MSPLSPALRSADPPTNVVDGFRMKLVRRSVDNGGMSLSGMSSAEQIERRLSPSAIREQSCSALFSPYIHWGDR